MKHLKIFLLLVFTIFLFESNAYATVILPQKITLETGTNYRLTLNSNIKAVHWTSSNRKVAALSQKRKSGVTIRGLKKGTSRITARIGKKRYSCIVNVKKTTPLLSAKSLEIKKGNSQKIYIFNTSEKAKVTSSNTKVATVKTSKNVITVKARTAGRTFITVNVGGRKLKCMVKVLKDGEESSTYSDNYYIDELDSDTEINVGETGQLYFENACSTSNSIAGSYTAKSSNPQVIRITTKTPETVYFEGTGIGTANIILSLWNGQVLSIGITVKRNAVTDACDSSPGSRNSFQQTDYTSYNMKIHVYPNRQRYYTEMAFAIYITSDKSLSLEEIQKIRITGVLPIIGGYYDDVAYMQRDNSVSSSFTQLADGNILYRCKSILSGTRTIALQVPSNNGYITVDSTTIDFIDYNTAKKHWMYQVINQATTQNMTNPEKMTAICKLLINSSRYYAVPETKGYGYLSILDEAMLPYWEWGEKKFRTNSYETPYLIVEFGSMIGYELESLYDKYPPGTADWAQFHYAACPPGMNPMEAWSKDLLFRCCPSYETGIVSGVSTPDDMPKIDFKRYYGIS